MRRHAKAPTAGSTKRQATGLGRFFRGAFATRDASPRAKGSGAPKARALVLAAAVLALVLALAVGSASGSTTRFFEEVFGSASEPSFSADRGLAYDQGADHLYVIDSTADVLQRFNADGSAADFSALGSNEIDGEGGAGEDATAHGHLAFESNDEREQVAIDESGEGTDGNVYVTQAAKDVIDIFNGDGEYLGELSESTEGGEFGEPCGVAVDGEGTVYVGDRGDDLIHVFDPEAAAAVPVNADSAAESIDTVSNPCSLAAGTGETAGFLFVNQSSGSAQKVDATTGEVKYEIASSANTLTVDPTTGHVFLARNCCSGSTVEEYDASEAAEATLVSAFSPGSTTEGVAVDGASEEVYVARSSTENVEVFGPAAIVPDVVTEEPSSNTGVRATLAGTVNPDGVELDECFFEWGEGLNSTEYTEATPCAETPAEIGAGTTPVAVSADLNGLIPQGGNYHYRLVAVNPNATINGSNQNFTTPDTVTTQAASGFTPTEATLNGTVNPDGTAITECVFEWGSEKGPLDLFQSYPETAPCVPGPGGIGSGTSPVAVSADLSELHPGTRYAYRLKAANANGTVTGQQLIAQTTGPRIVATWSEDIVRTEAILKAQIKPEGEATTYRFEYGKTEAYGSETAEFPVGADSSPHEVARFLSDLEPDTTYHYRAVATSGVAENVGPDRVLATHAPFSQDTDCPNQAHRYGAGANLPDCRAYEMVTPIDKNGADIDTRASIGNRLTAQDQGATDGNRFTYSSYRAFGDAIGHHFNNQFLATRGAGGWSSHGINPAHSATVNGFSTDLVGTPPQYHMFNDDLSSGWLVDDADPALTADGLADHYNVYRRDNLSGDHEALTTGLFGSAPVKLGTVAGPVLGAQSRDGDHVVFSVGARLTADAAAGSNYQVYDFTAGAPHLVSVLPGGEPSTQNSFVGAAKANEEGWVSHAVSDDGSRIFWTAQTTGSNGRIYVRIDGETTVPVSESVGSDSAFLWSASADGSEALFEYFPTSGSSAVSLFRFDVDSGTPSLVAKGMRGVVGASDDLSRVYFVSTEDLAPGATAGGRNLYVDHAGTTTFITALSAQDVGSVGPTARVSSQHFGQVTADGLRVAFNSSGSLTGYDNTSIDSGEPAVEVYVYDAAVDRLLCASCNPSGARPRSELLRNRFNGERSPFNLGSMIWAAASLTSGRRQTHASRGLSADGDRVFFNADDALVPEDTNGVLDVYQWEAQGAGGCTDPDGCISLISTGRSPAESEFVDSSANGRDVFFRTSSSIDPEDPGLIDIYDARAGGGYPPPPAPARPCLGDSCQSVPSAPSDPTPASAAFRGAEDPTPASDCRGAARRAVKLSRNAKRLRRAAKRATPARRARRLRRRSVRMAKSAKRLSRNAKRCRHAGRRAAR